MKIPFSLETFTSLWLICSIIMASYSVATAIEYWKEEPTTSNTWSKVSKVIATILVTAFVSLLGPIGVGITLFDSYDKRK